MARCIAEIKSCPFWNTPAFLNMLLPLLGVPHIRTCNCSTVPSQRAMLCDSTASVKPGFLGSSRGKLYLVHTQCNRQALYPKYALWTLKLEIICSESSATHVSLSQHLQVWLEENSAHTIPGRPGDRELLWRSDCLKNGTPASLNTLVPS